MKRIVSKLDRIGIGIFILILINLVVLLLSRDFSRFEYFDFSFLLNFIIGLFLIVKSIWCKLLALILSIFSLIFIFNQLVISNISEFLKILPHLIATKSIYISEIFYFVVLPIIIAVYCVFELATDISNKKSKKLV